MAGPPIDPLLREIDVLSLLSTPAGPRAEAAAAREAAHYGRMRRHCATLKENYRRVARCPWLPVAPDPPEPE